MPSTGLSPQGSSECSTTSVHQERGVLQLTERLIKKVRMGMRLDTALKLYIGLYVLCFILALFVSVPMLIHVTPQSECLLFVTPYTTYGAAIGCQFVGYAPILVCLSALVLIGLHILQLRSLRTFLRKRGPHSSDYHHRPTHIFWRMVVFHGCVSVLVLVIVLVLSAGYLQTCSNLHHEVSQTVRARVRSDLWNTGRRTQEIVDVFADDRSIERYTNPARDAYGESAFEHSITCRSVLTDPDLHFQLKKNHADNPYFRQYYGFWYRDDIADVGNIRYLSYRNNLILEVCLVCGWLSVVAWVGMLVLMLKERHHLRSHLRDETSVLNMSSRRSQISNQSFDRMSRHSNGSMSSAGNRSRSSSGNRPRVRQQQPALPTNRPDSSLMRSVQHEDEVDVDEALNNEPFNHDTSFEIPVVIDNTIEPYPMGDEVSSGQISLELAMNNENTNSNYNGHRQTGRRGNRGNSSNVNNANYNTNIPNYNTNIPNYNTNIPNYNTSIPNYSGTNPNYNGPNTNYSGNISYIGSNNDYMVNNSVQDDVQMRGLPNQSRI